MKFREKMRRFLSGRYGGDGLTTVLSVVSLASFIIAVIIRAAAPDTAGTIVGGVFYALALASLAFSTFRIMSRDLTARRAEYDWYRRKIADPARRLKNEMKTRSAQRRTHRFFKCPKCRQTVRVPKGKGKVRITCPKCGEVFTRKT
ncbi:MAG: zinc ribbon domain-containing protein [Clostridia bacterium]|nr:zinc ribbon domain-containing protein [Clostridia bacterium]